MPTNEPTKPPLPGMNRRDLLRWSLAVPVVWAGARVPTQIGDAEATDLFAITNNNSAHVFPQSVASGDPAPDGIVLWTRVDPTASAKYKSWQENKKVKVAFEVATDTTFHEVVLRGKVETTADKDFTLKTQIRHRKLAPFTEYAYRFIFEHTTSRTGRFRTLPAAGAPLDELRLGYTSCQDYTNGYYNALRYLAEEELHYVVHLGDYIYETASADTFQRGGPPERQFSLPDGGTEAHTLDEYRFLYKKYRSDPDLQRLHERYATIHIWDDHEFANDCYGVFTSDTEGGEREPSRRAAANQAWVEYLPVGVPYQSSITDPTEEITIYRSFEFGTLARLVATDERLYRDSHPCGETTTDKYATPGCGTESDPGRTMLGDRQREWFLREMTSSPALWKIWANETMVPQFKLANTELAAVAKPFGALDYELAVPVVPDVVAAPVNGALTDGVYLNLDQWDGYQHERRQIAEALTQVVNALVITGDLHSYMAGYLKVDHDDPLSQRAAVCFMAGSVTSANLEELLTGYEATQTPSYADLVALYLASNPHLRFFNSNTHGYNVLTLRPDEAVCEMKGVNTILRPEATLNTIRTFTVPAGSNHIIEGVRTRA